MIDAATQVQKLLRQQASIARFGSFTLRERDLDKILAEAVRVCADGLGAPFCKICRYRAEENDLLIVAGHGWQAGVVGNVVSRADMSSPQGRAFTTGLPSIIGDLEEVASFNLPPFYAAHGIVSIIDVIIKGIDDQPYGILEIDNDKQHAYDQYDINFLTGFANVVAEAVATVARGIDLQVTVDQMKALVKEKDRLLHEKMPGSMDGRQLADAALQRRGSLKVLFTSGYSNEAIIHHGHLDAGVLLLAKPYRKSDLARMIRAALAA